MTLAPLVGGGTATPLAARSEGGVFFVSKAG
jgi:hypothetical protein